MKEFDTINVNFSNDRNCVQFITNVNGYKLIKHSVLGKVYICKNGKILSVFDTLQSAYEWSINQ